MLLVAATFMPSADPSDKHGVHRYTAEEFGLDPADLAERFAVYRETFGLS